MVLACNNVEGAESIIDGLEKRVFHAHPEDVKKGERVLSLLGSTRSSDGELAGLKSTYNNAVALINKLRKD